MEGFDFEKEAKRIVESAGEKGIILRVLGATAFRIHCPNQLKLHLSMNRNITDLDFVSYSGMKRSVFDLMDKFGYPMDRSSQYVMAVSDRYMMKNTSNGLSADIFFDELNMCHKIDFRGRLEVDFPTIPPAELLLEKMQIVKLNEKDLKDSIVLIREHDVGPEDKEAINYDRISEVMSKNWGFYYTFTGNMNKLRNSLSRFDALSQEDRDDITTKIDKMLEQVEERPKSMSWKMRARTGARMKWYRDVEEVYCSETIN